MSYVHERDKGLVTKMLLLRNSLTSKSFFGAHIKRSVGVPAVVLRQRALRRPL